MRATCTALGIKGLFPLIRELCPGAISYPARYEGLRGQRLAIDATLLVQRLHFAPDQHEQRHLIGLYRLVQTLRAHDIAPIMVFDHLRARLPQKERERERRRLARMLSRGRANVERKRAARLQELDTLLARLQEMPEGDRQRVRRLLVSPSESSTEEVVAPIALDEGLSDDVAGADQLPTVPLDEEAFLARLDESEALLEEIPTAREDVAPTWQEILELEASASEAIAMRLASLRSSFETEANDVQARNTTSQEALTAMEASIYAALSSPTPSVEPERAAKQAVDSCLEMATSLAQSSEVAAAEQAKGPATSLIQATLEQAAQKNLSLSQTYNRQSSTLSAELFESSARLLGLLSVPVLWTGSGERSGPLAGRAHEAEAVASMLVKAGWADAVASEDSDVVLYEVPLVRGLLGAKQKLEVVDSAQVRRGLFPPAQAGSSENARPLTPEEAEEQSQSKMLEFALLAGTDYNRTLPGVAAKTALKLIGEHGTVTEVANKLSHKYKPPDGISWRTYKSELHAAREVFRRPPSIRRYLPVLRAAQEQRKKAQEAAAVASTDAAEKRTDEDAAESFLEQHGVKRGELQQSSARFSDLSASSSSAGFGEALYADGGPGLWAGENAAHRKVWAVV